MALKETVELKNDESCKNSNGVIKVEKFVLVFLTCLMVDLGVIWAYYDGDDDARLSQSSWLESLGIRLEPRDITNNNHGLLFWTRVGSSLLTGALAIHMYFTNDYPLVKSDYDYMLHVKRLKRFTTFTLWCWSLLTIYFGWCVFHALYPESSIAVAARIYVPILFEMCLSTSVLVTSVVHFVLVPTAKRKDPYRYSRLMNWRAVTLHYANVTMMFVEAVLNGLPMHDRHWLFALAFCNVYVIFAWVWHYHTGVFYYFFLNYNKFWWSPLAYCGLFFIFGGIYKACAYAVSMLR